MENRKVKRTHIGLKTFGKSADAAHLLTVFLYRIISAIIKLTSTNRPLRSCILMLAIMFW